MLLLIDNYDSFSHTLLDYFRQCRANVKLIKNDSLSLAEIVALQPSAIVFSPGPGTPDDAGITLAAIRQFAGKIPLLGVCLGHQAIAQAFGGTIVRAPEPVHGKTDVMLHDGQTLFYGLANPLKITRYHSLMVEPTTLPESLTISARTCDGIIMAIRHKKWPIEGVQFHPEAIMTDSGLRMIEQFLTAHYLT